MKFAALLRGVNVGGVTVKMAELKALLEKAGFEGVKTLLASGNVVFESASKNSRSHAAKIEKLLEARYKRPVRVIVRPVRDIEMFAKTQPYKSVKAGPRTKLYATFLDKPPKKHLKFDDKHFTVVKTCPFVIAWVTWDPTVQGTVDFMEELHKYYGKDITTRNWNTVQKILEADS